MLAVDQFGLSSGNGGWVAVHVRDHEHAYVRFAEAHGRLRAVQLVLGQPVDGPSLRRFPIGLVESFVNSDEAFGDSVRARLALPGPPVDVLVSHYAYSWNPRPRHPERLPWVAQAMLSQLPGSPLLHVEPLPHSRPDIERGQAPVDARLEVPDGRPWPDSFYVQVADAYRALVTAGLNPGQELASQNGVPATTAHRWIRAARERGHLPPGQRGKVG